MSAWPRTYGTPTDWYIKNVDNPRKPRLLYHNGQWKSIACIPVTHPAKERNSAARSWAITRNKCQSS